tara:strand:+ start:1613 stop:1837 length:225 start_codon:yes stop_codon:yes gene_type:complete
MDLDIDDQLDLGELLFTERKCRSCGKIKNLTDDYYLTRKNRTMVSAYSYECKTCTIERVKKNKGKSNNWAYPDW